MRLSRPPTGRIRKPPNLLWCSNPSCQVLTPASVHSSRSPRRIPRLQAQLLSCSMRHPLAVHPSHLSRRQEPTRRLTRVVRELHSQPRTFSRSLRSTLRLRRRQLQSRPRLILQPRVRSRYRVWLLRLLLSRRWPPRRYPSRCHLPLLSCRLIRSRLYW